MDNAPSEAVKVTQADRLAFCDYEDFDGAFRERVLDGSQDDTAGIIAFARHREEAEKRIVDWLRRREAAHRKAFSKALDAGHEGHVDKYAAQSLALEGAVKAIERGDHHSGEQ